MEFPPITGEKPVKEQVWERMRGGKGDKEVFRRVVLRRLLRQPRDDVLLASHWRHESVIQAGGLGYRNKAGIHQPVENQGNGAILGTQCWSLL